MYTLVWEENFEKDGMLNRNEWEYFEGCPHPEAELEYYQVENEENTFIKNNKLTIRAQKKDIGNFEYTSAKIRTKRSWKYGKFEIRAKLPLGKGTWPAIWLMPEGYREDEWPECGEIDIMEHLAQKLGIVHFSVHSSKYNWIKGNDRTKVYDIKERVYQYNTYTMIWTKKSIEMMVNNKLCFKEVVNDKTIETWPFDKEYYLILNLAIGGWGGAVDMNVCWPQDFIIDYIKVFQETM